MTAKYYKAGINSSAGTANYPPVTDRYYLGRFSTSKTNAIATIKSKIDIAISQKGWIIFLSHSSNSSEFDSNFVGEIMDYVLFKQLPVLTLKQAWEHKKSLYGESTDTEIPNAEEIIIYPNPVKSTFHIKTNNQYIKNIGLFNAAGQLVKQFSNTNSNEEAIDISEQPAGIYMLRILTYNNLILKKIRK